MPLPPPRPNPAPPKQDDCEDHRLAMRAWDKQPYWRCGHARRSPFTGTFFSEMASWPGYALAAARQALPMSWRAELIVEELRQRGQKCAPCRAQDRRVRRAAALVIAAAIAVLLVGWRLHG